MSTSPSASIKMLNNVAKTTTASVDNAPCIDVEATTVDETAKGQEAQTAKSNDKADPADDLLEKVRNLEKSDLEKFSVSFLKDTFAGAASGAKAIESLSKPEVKKDQRSMEERREEVKLIHEQGLEETGHYSSMGPIAVSGSPIANSIGAGIYLQTGDGSEKDPYERTGIVFALKCDHLLSCSDKTRRLEA